MESEREEGPGPAGGCSGSCRKGEGHADGGTGIGILAERTLQKRLAHAGPASTRGGRRNPSAQQGCVCSRKHRQWLKTGFGPRRKEFVKTKTKQHQQQNKHRKQGTRKVNRQCQRKKEIKLVFIECLLCAMNLHVLFQLHQA